jgi:hypothetical protein
VLDFLILIPCVKLNPLIIVFSFSSCTQGTPAYLCPSLCFPLIVISLPCHLFLCKKLGVIVATKSYSNMLDVLQ